MLLLLWEIFLLFIVLCFQGKQSFVCICVCTYIQCIYVCMWKYARQVKTIEESVASLLNLPEISFIVTTFLLTPIFPKLFIFLLMRVDICGQSASDSQCLFLTFILPCLPTPNHISTWDASFLLPVFCRKGAGLLSSHE